MLMIHADALVCVNPNVVDEYRIGPEEPSHLIHKYFYGSGGGSVDSSVRIPGRPENQQDDSRSFRPSNRSSRLE